MARIFEYDGKRYPDPDPAKSVEEVRQVLANFFPELSNAATGSRKESDDEIITFTKRVGTKGTPSITKERSLQIALNLQAIVLNVNAITEEELREYIQQIGHDETIGPLLDPTIWRDGLFEHASKMKKVLNKLLTFKQTVKVIGDFK